MARPLRIEFAGAAYHITSRGDRREAIYRDVEDSQHLGVEPIHCLGDHRQMTLAILVVAVNRLTPVAARCDVVDGVGEFDAQGAGHGVILRGEVGNWLDLTPGSL